MAMSAHLCVFSLLLLGHGGVEASHEVYRQLHTSEPVAADSSADQPYRTAYHLQPPKDWMNGQVLSSNL